MNLSDKYEVAKRIPLLGCSLSIRKTKDDHWHIAIFHGGKIFYRINRNRLLRFGAPKIIGILTGAPLLFPPPLAEAILNFVYGSLDLDNFLKIIEYYNRR